MQIIQLVLSHDNFFCPVTGQRITDSESYEASPAMVGMWLSFDIDMAEFHDSHLESQWELYKGQLAEDEFCDMEVFLKSVERDDYVCFEISTSGMSCGPASSTA